MRKVYFLEAIIESFDNFGFRLSAERRDKAGKRTVKLRNRALNDIEQGSHGRDHDKAVPQAAAQLQDLGEDFLRLLPEAPHAKNSGVSFRHIRRFDPAVFDFRSAK